jgi:hypothetical protein
MEIFLHDKWMLVHDAGDLILFIVSRWVALVTGGLGAILILLLGDRLKSEFPERLKPWFERFKVTKLIALLIAFFPLATFTAWHDLSNQLRASERVNKELKQQLAETQKLVASPAAVIDNATAAAESPIVTGSKNSITYGSPPPDKPFPKHPRREP